MRQHGIIPNERHWLARPLTGRVALMVHTQLIEPRLGRSPRDGLGENGYTAAVTGDTTTVVARVEAVLREGPPLRLGFVFGSTAQGAMHPGSDLDVGILPVDPELPLHTELELQSRLEAACGRSVDLVRL